MKKLTLAASIVFGAFALAGCNTMEGFGQDLQSAGTTLKKSASENNPTKDPNERNRYTPSPNQNY